MAKGTTILITGMPGSGKTTLFKRFVEELRYLKPVGFYTAEIRKHGKRRGFRLNSLDGRTGILAHVDFQTGYRVGKYGVDVAGFEAFIEPLTDRVTKGGLVMIDEIGKMECFADGFRKIIKDIINSDTPLIATIAQKGGGFIAELKNQPHVQLFKLTRENQDILFDQICSDLKV